MRQQWPQSFWNGARRWRVLWCLRKQRSGPPLPSEFFLGGPLLFLWAFSYLLCINQSIPALIEFFKDQFDTNADTFYDFTWFRIVGVVGNFSPQFDFLRNDRGG